MDSTDPYFLAGARFKLFSSDPGSGSERGLVRNQIKSRISYPYLNFKVSNPPDGKKTTILSEIKILEIEHQCGGSGSVESISFPWNWIHIKIII